MSNDPRRAPRPYRPSDDDDSDARRGSVRAARERLQMAQRQQQLPDRSRIVGLPQRPNQLVSQFSADGQQQLRPPQSAAPQGSRNKAPSPQWPLSNDQEDVLDSRPGQYRSSNRTPPQRPPRPTSDELPIQPTSPSEYRESFQSDDVFSPTSATPSSRPLTTSSAASEGSSLGDIPDFPIPQPPMPAVQPLPRRQPTLGPPPSSRRGPPSYYTQMSYVSPIVEEAETRSDAIHSHHGSFASSNVIPSNNKEFYLEEEEEDDDDERSDDDETITSDYGRESRASDHDDKSGLVTPALVRQASLGRRTKPSLMTIKSVDSLEKKGGVVKRKPIPDPVFAGAGAAGIGGAMMAARDGVMGQPPSSSSLSNGTGLLDPSSSSSESLTSLRNTKPGSGDAESQRALNAGLESPGLPLPQAAKQPSLADRIGKRRIPPRIDVDAVREAEARGSLTSLPELIRRATRLAANLDRGKTASRLGLDFWEAGADDKGRYDARRSGSLSDMLAAFPPPGEATPTGDRTPNPNRTPKWPGGAGARYDKESRQSDRESKRRRRCCGMPVWTFVTLLIVLLFLIAAAVVIPVVLIVLPKMNNKTGSAQATSGNGNGNGDNTSSSPPAPTQTSASSNGQCAGIITCQNGGVAIQNSDLTCNCVCINGFVGKTCGTEGDAGCTTTNVQGAANNATIGSGIPRLLESAQSNFSIPLNSTQLLSLFSNLSLSCNTENALVTFNGLASRSVPIIVESTIEPSRSLPLLDLAQRDQGIRPLSPRQAIGDFGNAKGNANTDSGGSATATGEATATATPSIPISSNTTAIDFARIGVLLVLQETRALDTAASAQEAIQEFLTNDRKGNSNGNTVNLGPFEIDLVKLSIDFQNGTTIKA